MKKILITGSNSYIGMSFENWLKRESDKYIVDTVDMKNENWRSKNFSGYDVIFHVAGIAHIKETKANRELYYEINRDLAYETAKKAKIEGVRQFVFLSSMSVYGIESGVINKDTPIRPNTAYGKSKIEAEEKINNLHDDTFTVAILRPPMVYGRGCKGNYQRLANLALKTPIFPDIKNQRSMIFIDNLSEFVKQLVDHQSGGVFFPQNSEYVITSEMVLLIAKAHEKKVFMTKWFNPLLSLLKFSTVKKVFGDLIYEMCMSGDVSSYAIVSFEDSIKSTEV